LVPSIINGVKYYNIKILVMLFEEHQYINLSVYLTINFSNDMLTFFIFLLSSLFDSKTIIKFSAVLSLPHLLLLMHCLIHFRSVIHPYSTMDSEASFHFVYNTDRNT